MIDESLHLHRGEGTGSRHYVAVLALEVGGKDAFVGGLVVKEAAEGGLDRYLPEIGERSWARLCQWV